MRSSIPNGRPGRAVESVVIAGSGVCSTTTRERRNASAFGIDRVLGHYGPDGTIWHADPPVLWHPKSTRPRQGQTRPGGGIILWRPTPRSWGPHSARGPLGS